MKTIEMKRDPIQTMNMTGFSDFHPRVQLLECHSRGSSEHGKAEQSNILSHSYLRFL